MGDRAQVKVVDNDDDPAVFLYTHSAGNKLLEQVHNGMKVGESRWDDAEYLARILFDAMTEFKHGQTLGYGIGVYLHPDLQYPLITVDCSKQQVIIGGMVASFGHFVTDEGLEDAQKVYR